MLIRCALYIVIDVCYYTKFIGICVYFIRVSIKCIYIVYCMWYTFISILYLIYIYIMLIYHYIYLEYLYT